MTKNKNNQPWHVRALSLEGLFCLFLFLLPWQARYFFPEGSLNGGYFEYGTFSLYATDILFAIILAWVLIRNWPRRRKDRPATAWLVVSAFEIWVFITIFLAQDFGSGLYFYLRVLQGIGLVYLLTQEWFSPKVTRLAVIAAGALQAAFAFVQFGMQGVAANKYLGLAAHQAFESGQFVVENATGRWLRAYGSFPHPNILGGFLAMAFILHVPYYYEPLKELWQRALLFATTLLLLLGLAVTFSKSAALGTLAGLFIFLLLKNRKTKARHRTLAAGALVFVLLLGLIYRQQLATRIMGQGELEVRSTQERVTQNQEAVGLMMWHPIAGVGAGQYALAVHGQVDDSRASYEYQPVHNIYLLLGAELGLIGLFLFIIFILYPTPIFHRDKLFLMIPSQYALLGALLVIGLFDHYLWSLQPGRLMLFLAIGLMYRTLILQQKLKRGEVS